MKIKSICIITPGYPTEKHPWFSFVDQLVCAFTDCGVTCTIISPQSFTKSIIASNTRRPTHWVKEHHSVKIEIFQPFILTASNLTINGCSVSDYTFANAAIKCFDKINKRFDAVYGHFWTCGLIAGRIGQKYGIPAFVACGESQIQYNKLKEKLKYKEFINGVICVSTKSKEECCSFGLCSEENTGIFPNGIDTNLFFKRDRNECRSILGFSKDIFIVSYVGAFSERKGSARLSAALSELEDVYSIFIGEGKERPFCNNCLVDKRLPHDEIPIYLCASDVFVLPTLNEGCCNAIIEAMACGLPIVSSDLSFNHDVLDANNAILVNPNNVTEIRNAIKRLKAYPEARDKMSKSSIIKAKELSIINRANKILAFMESRSC